MANAGRLRYLGRKETAMLEPLQLLKERRHVTREREPRNQDDDALQHLEHDPIICRHCGAQISNRHAFFSMDGRPASRIFSNPHGLLHEVFTVGRAHGLLLEGPPTTEFSWFPGYAWEVAYCAACRAHLGWQFTAVEPHLEPVRFWGLRCSEVADG